MAATLPRASAWGPSPPRHARLGPAQPGVKPGVKPKDPRSVRGSQARGRPGGANASEPLLMPREKNIPGRAAVPG